MERACFDHYERNGVEWKLGQVLHGIPWEPPVRVYGERDSPYDIEFRHMQYLLQQP